MSGRYYSKLDKVLKFAGESDEDKSKQLLDGGDKWDPSQPSV